MDALGIYISVPFCRAKCTYCNFASGVLPAGAHEPYVARVCADIGGIRRRLPGAEIPNRVDSIYLGGGTPGLLSPLLLSRLFQVVRGEFDVDREAEITMECAPGQLDEPALAALLDCGVNRISLGVQSLVDREAAATGRTHTRAVVFQDLDRLRRAGLTNLSIDLIAGMPRQTPASWQESLAVLAQMQVDHASVYMLEIDEDSRLGRELLAGGGRYQAPTVPSEDLTVDLYQSAIAALGNMGLEQYEISNFARNGARSRHNLKYWRRHPYLGFGLDAHSMLRTRQGDALRLAATSVLADFLAGTGSDQPQLLSEKEQLEEAWFLGLRLNDGVCLAALEAEFGREDVQQFMPAIAALGQQGLLALEGGMVRLTPRGVLLSNDVFAQFLGVLEGAPAR